MVFEIFKIRKNSQKSQVEPLVEEIVSEVESSGSSLTSHVANQRSDEDLSGTEINDYAKRHGRPVAEVWRSIREGRLLARSENGFVYVYGSEVHDLPQITDSTDQLVYNDSGELLRFSQNAIERVQQLNDAVIAAKDEVIAEKTEKICELRQDLEHLNIQHSTFSKEREQLLKRIEDLEILAKAIESL